MKSTIGVKLWLMAVLLPTVVKAASQYLNVPDLPSLYNSPDLPPGKPLAPPAYMVDNEGNTYHAAPDKGSLMGPILDPESLTSVHNNETTTAPPLEFMTPTTKRDGSFWMETISHGHNAPNATSQSPLAPSGYQFFRNVRDFGAKGDGKTDDTVAINQAVASFSQSDRTTLRCGQECGSTTILSALVYFPKGEYVISAPIMQYYFTQFVGDPNNKPTIKGTKDFVGIALIDTDYYIPKLSGLEWYINQNQFFRQIRNFKMDLTGMPAGNITDGEQTYAPTGIHWQVAQATSMQNVDFVMRQDANTTQVGIFMENGSGGFVSDLTFTGGSIGFRSGSQQYTARNLSFKSCQTAISMIWNWGFTWKNLNIDSCHVGIDCSFVGGKDKQGTGSMVVLDSTFKGVPYGITLSKGFTPNLVLDNLLVDNSVNVVAYTGGDTIFTGSSGRVYFTSWAMGMRYTTLRGNGTKVTGLLNPAPNKSKNLLDGTGNFYTRSRPQYEHVGNFVVATSHGIANDGTGDQAGAINTLLSGNVGTPIFFPAGIYQVQDTVKIPVNSIIVGEGWSQIRGTGTKFQDMNNTRVMVQVGNRGDVGSMEISDMLFTVKGPTAGAILMEWNVREKPQGSACMWDSHFRVGGAAGTNLGLDDCPKGTAINPKCIAASMLLHVTATASGYFENIWAWTADHDIDQPVDGGKHTDTAFTQINIYSARGVLIESEGPCWFYGTASEHNVFYQYQLRNAKDIFFGHMQSETPYMQPTPGALQPFTPSKALGDPTFPDCADDDKSCEMAWALRVLSSLDIFIYSAGLYSFFSSYTQDCLKDEACQMGLIETSYSQGLWIYNLFTIGAVQAVTPRGGLVPVLQQDTQMGFSTEISAWLALAISGGDLGGDGGSSGGSGVVYIDPIIWFEPSPTLHCFDPCTMVLPPSTLPSPVTIVIPPQTVSVTVGGGSVKTVTVTVTTITTSIISFSPVVIPDGTTTSTFAVVPSFRPPPVTVGGTTYPVPRVPYPFIPYSGISTVTMTKSSSSTTSVWPFPVLATTVVTSGSITQTFTEIQITELSKLSRTVQLTTSWTGSGSSTTTTTPVLIWIQTGGFAWSPIPLPGPTPFPLPPLPGPPPLPKPPCFKLFGVFSINCPPNKGNPTTHYTSGKPQPTCHSNCGTLDQSDDNDSTETCATETRTRCENGGCVTYVGCECRTSTATDYWVSCSSRSCTTTKSEVITGCHVSATATTTGSGYCVADSGADPSDEQADDSSDRDSNGDPPPITPAPPSAVQGGNTVTASGGSVVIGGNTYPIPTNGLPTTVNPPGGGGAVTIYPGYGITSTEKPSSTRPKPTTTSPTVKPSPSPYYDCEGETLCSTTNVKWCDEAVNRMQRGSKIYTSNQVALALEGNCWANYEQFGCKVTIRGTHDGGKNCQITGDDMWNAYQDIRKVGGCSKCGSKHFGDGCLVSIDYYYGCDNRDPGPNRMNTTIPIRAVINGTLVNGSFVADEDAVDLGEASVAT